MEASYRQIQGNQRMKETKDVEGKGHEGSKRAKCMEIEEQPRNQEGTVIKNTTMMNIAVTNPAVNQPSVKYEKTKPLNMSLTTLTATGPTTKAETQNNTISINLQSTKSSATTESNPNRRRRLGNRSIQVTKLIIGRFNPRQIQNQYLKLKFDRNQRLIEIIGYKDISTSSEDQQFNQNIIQKNNKKNKNIKKNQQKNPKKNPKKNAKSMKMCMQGQQQSSNKIQQQIQYNKQQQKRQQQFKIIIKKNNLKIVQLNERVSIVTIIFKQALMYQYKSITDTWQIKQIINNSRLRLSLITEQQLSTNINNNNSNSNNVSDGNNNNNMQQQQNQNQRQSANINNNNSKNNKKNNNNNQINNDTNNVNKADLDNVHNNDENMRNNSLFKSTKSNNQQNQQFVFEYEVQSLEHSIIKEGCQ